MLPSIYWDGCRRWQPGFAYLACERVADHRVECSQLPTSGVYRVDDSSARQFCLMSTAVLSILERCVHVPCHIKAWIGRGSLQIFNTERRRIVGQWGLYSFAHSENTDARRINKPSAAWLAADSSTGSCGVGRRLEVPRGLTQN